MSQKTLKIVLGVVGALLVLYGITVAFGSRTTSAARADALADVLASIDEESIASIRFYDNDDTVELRRTGDGWSVNGYPADSGQVARLWQTLEEARAGQLVARNPANHARLGVADDSARVAELHREQGEPLRLLLGRDGPSYPSAYVRLPGSDEVYLLHADLAAAARRAVAGWRDKTIIRLDTARAHRIEIERDGRRYALVRGSEGWTIDGSAADSAAVRNLLTELASLVATGFAPDTARLSGEVRTVTALGSAGDTLARITLAEGRATNWRVRVRGADAIFEITGWRADRLAPERAELVRD